MRMAFQSSPILSLPRSLLFAFKTLSSFASLGRPLLSWARAGFLHEADEQAVPAARGASLQGRRMYPRCFGLPVQCHCKPSLVARSCARRRPPLCHHIGLSGALLGGQADAAVLVAAWDGAPLQYYV